MKALVTGITGQDGSYLAELLLEKGYEVHGLVRRCTRKTSNIDHLMGKVILHEGDMTDAGRLSCIVAEVKPDECYNLAAQSHVRVSFDSSYYTSEVVALGTLSILESIRKHAPGCKFYQASTSEMFGSTPGPQDENTTFCPQSPYAASKVYAHHITNVYRDAYDIYACSGILFNHESPRRGEEFLTRKVTKAVGEIVAGKRSVLELGNLSAHRDWGFAKEYVEVMWMMLQQDDPDDYVIATGETHSVEEFVRAAFLAANLEFEEYVKINEDLYRPNEVVLLQGDPSKAKRILGWEPQVKFKQLVDIMVQSDLGN